MWHMVMGLLNQITQSGLKLFHLYIIVGLILMCSKLIASTSSPVTKGTAVDETPFSSLSLRLHEPYWLLHEGNCEHYIVFDEIRYVVVVHHCVDISYFTLQGCYGRMRE